MSTTVADVKAAVQARGYGTDTTAAQLEFLKSALRRVYGMRRWRFLTSVVLTQTAVADDPIVDLTTITGLTAVSSVRYYDGDDLTGMDYRAPQALFDTDADHPGVTGAPQLWTQAQPGWVQVWPKPDRDYPLHIVCTVIPEMPTVDADVLDFPDDHVEVLVEYVVMLLTKRQRDWQAYNSAKADYQEALQDMIRADSFTQRQTSAEVERWSGWDEVER